MDCFLNFRNKKHEAKYHENIDPYLSNVLTSTLVVVAAGLPFTPYTQYLRFKESTAPMPVIIRRALLGLSLYIVLLAVALIVYKMPQRLKKHQKAIRWVFDIFFNLMAGYLAYMYWDSGTFEKNPVLRYYWGWWNSLMVVALLTPISRWYLKLSAYLILILRIGISSYITEQKPSVLINMFQMIILEMLLNYYNERGNRKQFIEKHALYEETKVFREIFDETADGVIIYGLDEGMLFRNWNNEKYRWWQQQFSIQENFESIVLKGFKKATQLPYNIDSDLNSLVQPTIQPNLWVFLNQLVKDVKASLEPQNKNQRLRKGNMMVLTGHIEHDSSDPLSIHNYILEIKIMFTTFREKPALALIFSDITERNLVTALQENNEYKNRLLASVSHELRTPLNASINFTLAALEHPDLMSLPAASNIKENYLLPALRSNQLLLHLINDILDFSQMSANKLRLVYEKHDVLTTLEECVNLIKIQATRKGLKLTKEYELEDENAEFCTDHNRLKQIVLNLLSNALKFTLKGEINLKVKLTSSPRPKEKILSIEVSDTGIGISEENKRKLFKAFEKIELGDRNSINSQGVGLGLVISNNLVLMLGPPEQNNGMKVESQVNKGSKFSFWIIDQPQRPELNFLRSRSENNGSELEEFISDRDKVETVRQFVPKSTMDSIRLSSHRGSLGSQAQLSLISPKIFINKAPKVLVVDDDIFNITALEMMLSKLGYSCDTAYNGEQAIEKVMERHAESREKRSNQYKVIFMDWSMPIMDGFEASSVLKEKIKANELDEIAIIACTAFLSEREKQRANEIGIDGYCIKPLNKEKIIDQLKTFAPKC